MTNKKRVSKCRDYTGCYTGQTGSSSLSIAVNTNIDICNSSGKLGYFKQILNMLHLQCALKVLYMILILSFICRILKAWKGTMNMKERINYHFCQPVTVRLYKAAQTTWRPKGHIRSQTTCNQAIEMICETIPCNKLVYFFCVEGFKKLVFLISSAALPHAYFKTPQSDANFDVKIVTYKLLRGQI